MNNKGIVVGKNKDTNGEVLWGHGEYDRKKHMMIVGPIGSGKTSQSIIPFIDQDLQDENVGITLIEPNGDLAKQVYGIAQYYGRKAIYFDVYSDMYTIPNPLKGDVTVVIENLISTFDVITEELSTFLVNVNRQLIKESITVLKAVNGEETNLVEFNKFIHDIDGFGMKTIEKYSYLMTRSAEEERKKKNTIKWFKKKYFSKKTKLFGYCSEIRKATNDLIEAYKLDQKAADEKIEEIDFRKHLEDGDVVIISTRAADGWVGCQLLNRLILKLFHVAVFQKNRKCSKMNSVYIDEAQVYANSNMKDLVMGGVPRNIALHLAVQSMNGIEEICSNVESVILYPGIKIEDAEHFSKKFKGEITAKDIVYRPFGEATCALCTHGYVQNPFVLKNVFIPLKTNS